MRDRRGRAGRLLVAAVMLAGVSVELAVAEDAPPAFHYDPKGHRDPFMPLVRDGRVVGLATAGSTMAEPELYGILWDPEGRSLALINDREVQVGDVLGDYEVARIEEGQVVLIDGAGEARILRMAFEESLQDAPPPAGATTGGRHP